MEEGFPLADEQSISILMHRECHFAGQFSLMLEYYHNDGVGRVEDFSIERIQELADYEEQIGTNIAPLLLTGPDAEKVAQVREIYRNLREIYEVKNPKSRHPLLIADLILSEEAEPQK